MDAENNTHDSGHTMTYRAYVAVWAGLIALTALTVGVSYLDMKHVGMLAALLVAGSKATLVVLYFMHIRFERRLHLVMIAVVVATYLVFIGLTFSDYGER